MIITFIFDIFNFSFVTIKHGCLSHAHFLLHACIVNFIAYNLYKFTHTYLCNKQLHICVTHTYTTHTHIQAESYKLYQTNLTVGDHRLWLRELAISELEKIAGTDKTSKRIASDFDRKRVFSHSGSAARDDEPWRGGFEDTPCKIRQSACGTEFEPIKQSQMEMETLRLLYKRWPQCGGFYKMAVVVCPPVACSLYFFLAQISTRAFRKCIHPNFFERSVNKIITIQRSNPDRAKNILYGKVTIVLKKVSF